MGERSISELWNCKIKDHLLETFKVVRPKTLEGFKCLFNRVELKGVFQLIFNEYLDK